MSATMTVRELCELLNLSKPTVLKGIRDQQLPGYRVGAQGRPRVVIPRLAVERYLAGEWTPPVVEQAAAPVMLRRKSA